jgi:hypothetical protein
MWPVPVQWDGRSSGMGWASAAFSRFLAEGMGSSAMPTCVIGASRSWKHVCWTRAAVSAVTPSVGHPSSTQSTRLVFATALARSPCRADAGSAGPTTSAWGVVLGGEALGYVQRNGVPDDRQNRSLHGQRWLRRSRSGTRGCRGPSILVVHRGLLDHEHGVVVPDRGLEQPVGIGGRGG